MIELAIASAIQFASWQSTAADTARTALKTCIRTAAAEAKTQKIPLDAFPDFIRQKCATQETGLKSALWAFDSKNKVSRKQSEADANLQIEDFVLSAKDRYEMEMPPAQEQAQPQQAAQPQQPVPQQASQPQQ